MPGGGSNGVFLGCGPALSWGIVSGMDDDAATEQFRRKTGYRRKAEALKTAIPLPEYPKDHTFSVKSIAYGA